MVFSIAMATSIAMASMIAMVSITATALATAMASLTSTLSSRASSPKLILRGSISPMRFGIGSDAHLYFFVWGSQVL